MKRLLLAGVLAIGLSALADASAFGWETPGIGANTCHRVGRLRGYWGNPTTGPLYDYSAYFANNYPQIPGADEWQWRPNQPSGAYPTGPVARNR